MQSVLSINPQVTMDHQEQPGALNNNMGQRVMNRLFGCWIHELGRPFSNNGRTYRVCIKCGMSRDFDPASWKTHGYYHVTEPNVSNPKTRSWHPVPKNGKPSPTQSNLPQRVSSLGSRNRGHFDPNCDTGCAA